MAHLTTHVLDTARGKPAAGMPLRLTRIDKNQSRHLLVDTVTNQDGRTPVPLLEGATFTAATYELCFGVAAYFVAAKGLQDDPPFLDQVTIRFTVAHSDQHYHVPLLVSPWSYSTYRGS